MQSCLRAKVRCERTFSLLRLSDLTLTAIYAQLSDLLLDSRKGPRHCINSAQVIVARRDFKRPFPATLSQVAATAKRLQVCFCCPPDIQDSGRPSSSTLATHVPFNFFKHCRLKRTWVNSVEPELDYLSVRLQINPRLMGSQACNLHAG